MLSKLQTLKEEREQGFTLIELLVVILIIGILSAIAIPAFMNQRKSAVDSSVQSDISNAAKQIETFIVSSGSTAKPLPHTGTGIKDIKVSDGTTLTITGNTFGYQIKGTNSGGDVSSTTSSEGGFYYDSTKGGLVKKADYTATGSTVAGNGTVTVTKTSTTGSVYTAPVTP